MDTMVLIKYLPRPILYVCIFMTLTRRSCGQEQINFVQRNKDLVAIPTESIPENVMRIDLSVNLLESIATGTLQNFAQLQEFNASHNKISSIADDAFLGTQISSLWLNNNELTTVPELSHIANFITHLYLHFNRIKTIGSAEFSRVTQLQSLYLHHNELVTFEPEFPREGFESLRDVLIDNNQLSEIESKLFQYMKNLRYLNIANNKLSNLPDLSYLPVSNSLEYLDARYNMISDIEDETLSKIRSLVSLLLSGNRLTRIPTLTNMAATLRTLYTSSNQISDVPQGTFEGLLLTTVGMSSNRLTKIPDFFPLKSTLNYLSLSGNDFSDTSCSEVHTFLQTMTALKYLYMDEVGLTSFPDIRALINSSFSNLWILNTQTLVCDCTVVWMLEATASDDLGRILDVNPDSRPCGQPVALRDRPWGSITKEDLCPGGDGRSCIDPVPKTTATTTSSSSSTTFPTSTQLTLTSQHQSTTTITTSTEPATPAPTPPSSTASPLSSSPSPSSDNQRTFPPTSDMKIVSSKSSSTTQNIYPFTKSVKPTVGANNVNDSDRGKKMLVLVGSLLGVSLLVIIAIILVIVLCTVKDDRKVDDEETSVIEIIPPTGGGVQAANLNIEETPHSGIQVPVGPYVTDDQKAGILFPTTHSLDESAEVHANRAYDDTHDEGTNMGDEMGSGANSNIEAMGRDDTPATQTHTGLDDFGGAATGMGMGGDMDRETDIGGEAENIAPANDMNDGGSATGYYAGLDDSVAMYANTGTTEEGVQDISKAAGEGGHDAPNGYATISDNTMIPGSDFEAGRDIPGPPPDMEGAYGGAGEDAMYVNTGATVETMYVNTEAREEGMYANTGVTEDGVCADTEVKEDGVYSNTDGPADALYSNTRPMVDNDLYG